MHYRFKVFLKFSAFLSFGLFLLFLVYRYINTSYSAYCDEQGIAPMDCNLFDRIYNDFIGADYTWILISLLCYMISNLFRAQQWSLLLEPISHRPKYANSFWGVMLGYFANLGIPRMGEFIRTAAMSKYEDIPYEKVLASVINSRILDMIFLVLTTLIALVLQYDQLFQFYTYVGETYGFASLYIIGVLGIVMFCGFVLLLNTPEAKQSLLRKIQILGLSFKDGLISIFKINRPWALLGHTAAIWIMYVLMTYIGFWAYAPTADVPFSAGLVVFVIGALGFVVPSSGGMGTYHAMIIIGLSLYGVSEVDAFSYAMILFITLQIGANIFFGLLSLILLPRLNETINT